MNEQDAINLLGPSASFNSGLVNNAFSMMYNMYESERGRRFAASQAQKQRDYLTQMWYLNNEYNSPYEQMKRLKEAGLNPSLVYGQPVSEAQQPSGAAEASSGLLGAPHLTNPAAGLETVFADIDLKRAQAENLRSQIPVNKQRENNLRELTNNIITQGKILDLDLKKYQDTIETTIDSINMSNEASKEQSRFTVDELNVKRGYLEDTYKEQLRELRGKADEAEAHAREAGAKADVAEAEKNLINKKIEQLNKLFEQYNEILTRMKKDNSWYTADKIMGYITDLGNTTANIISAVGTLTNVAGSNPSFNNNSTERSRYVNENIFPGLED